MPDLIPVVHQGVHQERAHPILVERAVEFCDHRRVRGRIKAISIVRPIGSPGDLDSGDPERKNTSYYFWEAWQRRRAGQSGYEWANLAAPPGKSLHNERETPEGLFGCAIDWRLYGGLDWATVHNLAPRFGLWFPLIGAEARRRNIAPRYQEAWHCMGLKSGSLSEWIKPKRTPGFLAVNHRLAKAARSNAQHSPWSLPDPKKMIADAQANLSGIDLVPDGIVGPATRSAADTAEGALKVIRAFG